MKIKIVLLLLLFASLKSLAQGSPDYGDGFKFKLNEDGSKYIRELTLGQFWVQYNPDPTLDANKNEQAKVDFLLKRFRILMYSQITKDFFILTQFGLNNLSANNMSPTGTAENSQFSLIDAWVQYSLGEHNAMGAGLHYWNGISRMNNQGNLNTMTLDLNRQAQATSGLSDQASRHLGIYAKGILGKFQYRVAINDAETNNLQAGVAFNPTPNGAATYTGKRLLGSAAAGKAYAGYFEYGFLDVENNVLPYKVGTYLGTKKVFNIGAGFFHQPNGAAVADNQGEFSGQDVSIFGVDAFYDAPLGNNNSAITAYALFQNNDYGHNFKYGTTYETGSMLFAELGYVLPWKSKTRLQPYLSYNNRKIKALHDDATQLGIGANLYLSGHNSKLTLEYLASKYATNANVNTITLQAMIYL